MAAACFPRRQITGKTAPLRHDLERELTRTRLVRSPHDHPLGSLHRRNRRLFGSVASRLFRFQFRRVPCFYLIRASGAHRVGCGRIPLAARVSSTHARYQSGCTWFSARSSCSPSERSPGRTSGSGRNAWKNPRQPHSQIYEPQCLPNVPGPGERGSAPGFDACWPAFALTVLKRKPPNLRNDRGLEGYFCHTGPRMGARGIVQLACAEYGSRSSVFTRSALLSQESLASRLVARTHRD
jgi:hypothetical protein